MKQKVRSFLLFFIMGTFLLSAQSYNQLWKEVNLAEKEDKPQTAIEITQKIFRKAQNERFAPQMMRAYLTAMAHRTHLSTDSFYVDIAGLEKWVADPITPINDAAVLHSLLGSIYAYSAQGRYDNKVIEKLPEDMSQWTQLMYNQRSFDHFIASVNQLEKLQGYSTLSYAPITYSGKWSEMYQHDLMHLIGRRAAFGIKELEPTLSRAYKQTEWKAFNLDYNQFRRDTLIAVSTYDCPAQTMRIFQRMLTLLETPDKGEGWLSMEQNRLNVIPQYARDNDKCLQLFYGLKETFKNSDLCGSLCYDIATIYRQQGKDAEALAILREGITHYPSYGAINQLHNMEKMILQPTLFVQGASLHHYPGDTANLRVYHRNLNGFTVWLRRINCPLDTLREYTYNAEGLKKYSKFYAEQKYALLRDKEYRQQDTIVPLPLPKEAGAYLIETIANGKGSNLSYFYVSPYKLVSRSLPGDLVEYAVLDVRSGHPIADATLQTARYDHKKKQIIPIESKRTDRYGCVTMQMEPSYDLVRASTVANNTMPYVPKNYHSKWTQPNGKVRFYTRLFSDRTLFRPGQTIYIKGISHWLLPNDSIWAAKGEELELALKNPRGEIIEKRMVKNNEFGSFNAEFVLPTDGLNGSYRIEVLGGESHQSTILFFRMEEYKLPTFEVTFDKVKTAYAIGDTVTLTGQALTYSGVPVSEGKVSYTVRKNYYGWLRGWTDYRDGEEMMDGETVTDSDGRFCIKIYLKEHPDKEMLCWWRNEYAITGAVTSLSGESQEARTSLTLSSIPLELGIIQANSHWMKGKPHPLTFRVTNLSGEEVDTEVDYRIYQTNEDGDEKKGKLVHQGRTTSNQQTAFDFIDKLPSAYYKIVATTTLAGKKDSVVSFEAFTLYAENETKVPSGTTDWVNWLETKVDTNQPARLQFGTREKDAYILMDVFSETKRIDSRRFYMSDTVQTFTFDYQPEYGNCMYVNVMYVKNGSVLNYTQRLAKKEPEKKLVLKWETFRNKLKPGAQEEWILNVTHPDGSPADAELLASMYDTALNQLGKQPSWSFGVNFMRTIYGSPRWFGLGFRYPDTRINFDLLTKRVPVQWRYDGFAERYFNFNLALFRKRAKEESLMVGASRALSMTTATNARFNTRTDSDIIESQANGVLEEVAAGTQRAKRDAEPLPEGMQLREGFTETAFFQPHLRTDSTGHVKIAFTLPDNLTRWHFRALAHTRQMEYATLEDFATAQREFMIQPNLPRFVRSGDETTISAIISNLTDEGIKGTARLELIDPMTERVILTRKAKFNVQAKGTTTTTFTFTVKDNIVSLPVCRIVAEGDRFSDGEQRYLPILTDKVWITESLPLMLDGPGKVEESLGHLFNHHSPTASDHRLTVEMTGNPAWLAIQALPTIATPTSEDAFSWAAAWYAHSMASYIAQSQPEIKAVYDNWISETNGSKVLSSNLQKDEELKTLLLDETPWVTEATDEAAQKRQLALLFDKTNSRQRITGYLDKLESLQNEDGGWSWRKGMKSSRYVTTYIVELMERIIHLTGDEQNYTTRSMMAQATEFLNQELMNEYRHLKACEGKDEEARPSEQALAYLCSQALNGKRYDKEMQKAVEYMVKLLPGQLHGLTPYGKAKASIVLKHYGMNKEAGILLSSLKEYSTYTPQMGRFFDNPSIIFGWRNQRIPTQVAAVEALAFAKSDTLCIEQMKQWLLIQKQAQSWDNPLNTVDAIHALLVQSPTLLNTEKNTTLMIDGKMVKSSLPSIAGMDYLKHTYTTEELKRLPRKATIEKSDNGLAWGAVYAQYLEEMKSVTSTYTGRTETAYGQALDQPLSIERTWMVERMTNGQKSWEPVTEKTTLHVGDKIISQLTIRTDRAMDFVQIKNGRAACLEPVNSASGYRFHGGAGHYCSVKDASTSYFIDHLPKGVCTLEETFRIDRVGQYQAGIASVQCAYAPEFVGHTAGMQFAVRAY